MEVGRLLYATDMREPSFSEVEPVLTLRTLGLKEVVLLHTTKVEDWDGKVADHGLKSKTFMVDGPLVPAILNTAHRETVSLIAVSLNRDKRGLLGGSVTTKLLRASSLPVLIIPEDAQATRSMERGVFTHLVFATDWSRSSEKALGYILNFKDFISTLEIVHVIDKRLDVRDMRVLKGKLVQTRNVLSGRGIDAESHIYAGKRPEEIMLAAKDYDATCIVMGTSGKSALKALLAPSCSCRVAESSLVPTLVVP
ncbi:MAG: universal stress protein [Desulfobacterales bacterium]|nr:MAG: universal stress protein [Desulfobacterales bacterium]